MTPKRNPTEVRPRRKRVSFDEQRDSIRAAPEAAVSPDGVWSTLAKLEECWPRLSAKHRRRALTAYAGLRFRRRFGLPWLPEWRRWTSPPVETPRKRGRPLDTRALLVKALDFGEELRWPVEVCSPGEIERAVARGIIEQRGGSHGGLFLRRRPDSTSRFLSIVEYAWISLLCGNSPRTSGGPSDLIRTERAAMRQARRRHGRQPMLFARLDAAGRQKFDADGVGFWPTSRIQRGKQTR